MEGVCVALQSSLTVHDFVFSDFYQNKNGTGMPLTIQYLLYLEHI